jgi:hypothetical protein
LIEAERILKSNKKDEKDMKLSIRSSAKKPKQEPEFLF